MKNAMLIGTGALLLLFGISAPAFAQEQHDPQEQPAKPPDAKPATHDEQPQAEPPKTPDDRPRPDNAAKPPKDTERNRRTRSALKMRNAVTSTPATGGFLTTNTARTSAASTRSTSATR